MTNLNDVVKAAIKKYAGDPLKMLDIIRSVQASLRHVPDEAIELIAKELDVSRLIVDGIVTYYHFFSKTSTGKYTVYLDDSAVAEMKGRAAVADAFEKETGIKFGETSTDGLIGLYNTSCIGMSDQQPAAIINDHVFTNIDAAKVKQIVANMKAGKEVKEFIKEYGDGNNGSDLVRSMVKNNLLKKGQVVFAPFETGSALKKAIAMNPVDVIEEIKKSNLRGRGGAGFPVGMKWDSTSKSEGAKKYIVCNADEGEPGTFKDRVILTEQPAMIFEGMAVAGYAIGAVEGILYLRAEYTYLNEFLENVLADLRKKNILGKDICGKKGFNFDISISLGAGAYVCGEESALLESAEGKRGQPRNRPPFPAQKGYMDMPTSVNNVESFCEAVRIIVEGSVWFMGIGTTQSKGTKLISISGDCSKPGVYEVEFGTTLQELIDMAGGAGAVGVQVGGASGTCVSKEDFGRKICYADLATGGSFMIFGPNTDILSIVHNFMNFFIEESCGWCVPCRVGNVILRDRLEKIIRGNGTELDLRELEDWCYIVRDMSRCGLGTSSPNAILTTLKSFRHLYEKKIQKGVAYVSEFDLASAIKDSCAYVGRKPHLEEH